MDKLPSLWIDLIDINYESNKKTGIIGNKAIKQIANQQVINQKSNFDTNISKVQVLVDSHFENLSQILILIIFWEG